MLQGALLDLVTSSLQRELFIKFSKSSFTTEVLLNLAGQPRYVISSTKVNNLTTLSLVLSLLPHILWFSSNDKSLCAHTQMQKSVGMAKVAIRPGRSKIALVQLTGTCT